MLLPRIIPSLLLHKGGIVKTRRFKNPSYIGDPINAIRIFNEKEVDELLVLDIDATKANIEPDYVLIEKVAGECFMPLAYGGGIRTIKQAKRLFELGVEKICIQTAALDNPVFIKHLSECFGSQSIMVSIDIKKNILGRPYIFSSARKKYITSNWLQLINELVLSGAGEILFNCVDRDGTLAGPDLQLITTVCNSVRIPLIAQGGIACLDDIKKAVDAGASAVAAGAFFVYHGPFRAVLLTYPSPEDLSRTFSPTHQTFLP